MTKLRNDPQLRIGKSLLVAARSASPETRADIEKAVYAKHPELAPKK